MKRLGIVPATAAVVLMLLAPAPAGAWYDDVHYVLTYYVARRVGFTPIQAHRIASAATAVDYSPDTEPMQLGNQALHHFLAPNHRQQIPRWKFHAFYDQTMGSYWFWTRSEEWRTGGDEARGLTLGQSFFFPGSTMSVLHDTSEEVRQWQRAKVWGQFLELRRDAFHHGNPGLAIHYYQDITTHSAYGSAWGHGNPTPTAEPGLPQGGTTDWLSYYVSNGREEEIYKLYRTTFALLRQFMEKASENKQRPNEMQVDKDFMQALQSANSGCPPALSGGGIGRLSRRHMYHFYVMYALKQKLIAAAWGGKDWLPLDHDPDNNLTERVLLECIRREPFPTEIGAPPRRLPKDFKLHLEGPDLDRALEVGSQFLKRHRMQEAEKPLFRRPGMPEAFYHYDIKEVKDRTTKTSSYYECRSDKYWRWVVYGDLTVKLPTKSSDDDEGTEPSELTVWMLPTQKPPAKVQASMKRYMLIDPPRTVAHGETEVEFESMPLGEVEIEWRRPGREPLIKKTFLNRDKNEVQLSPEFSYAQAIEETAQDHQLTGRVTPITAIDDSPEVDDWYYGEYWAGENMLVRLEINVFGNAAAANNGFKQWNEEQAKKWADPESFDYRQGKMTDGKFETFAAVFGSKDTMHPYRKEGQRDAFLRAVVGPAVVHISHPTNGGGLSGAEDRVRELAKALIDRFPEEPPARD